MRKTTAFPLTALLVALSPLGCSSPEITTEDEGAWVGTITTEGDVTTVVNESGSVWGGKARLVEEASIGVEVGAEEYMFGAVEGAWATDDRILVLDSQVPVVRVYDLDGQHLFDFGRRGQGPGEFTDPAGLGVLPDGEILVIENTLQVDVFGPDGTPEDTWNSGSPVYISMPDMMLVGDDGAVWVPAMQMELRRGGRARIGDDGQAGEPVFPPELDWEAPCLTYTRRGQEHRYCVIPFQPFGVRSLMPDGGWAVGINRTYTFEVHEPDGTVLRVERFWDPVTVTAEEAAHRRQQTLEFLRERDDSGSWSWNGPEIPDHKPAYLNLWPDRNGRIWVLREQASQRLTDCPDGEAECWVSQGYWLDAFGPDGRFLGTVTLEQRPLRRPFIKDTNILAIIMDDAGTIMVKRYRLLLPGEATQ